MHRMNRWTGPSSGISFICFASPLGVKATKTDTPQFGMSMGPRSTRLIWRGLTTAQLQPIVPVLCHIAFVGGGDSTDPRRHLLCQRK